MPDNQSQLSRREFLKAAGLATGGVAMGSLALLTACNDTTSSATSMPTTTRTNSSNVPTVPPGVYSPFDSYPPLLEERYGCTASVAADRWYTDDHLWVKEWEEGKIVIGITDKMQSLLSTVTYCGFMFEEEMVADRGAIFAAVGAYKLSTDIIVPVSGKVLQINTALRTFPYVLNAFPYSEGWLAVMMPTRTQEMGDLIGPHYYAYLQAVNIPPTVPPKRS